MLRIEPDRRKDPAERARLLNAADVAFLCLPDAAAREAAILVTNPKTCVIDASTAPQKELRLRAERLAERIRTLPGIKSARATDDEAFVGGGSLPDQAMKTCVVEGFGSGGAAGATR